MIIETMPSAAGLSVSAVPGRAFTRLAVRQLRRSGLIVLGLTAGMPALGTCSTSYRRHHASPGDATSSAPVTCGTPTR